MLAFTSKSNTLRLGRFRSWAVRPYLHKKVNTTFLTRCCLYLVAYLSAYMRLWGAWLVAYSVLFSRDRIIIHAFYWRFPLVKGRLSRYGLCWLSNHYVPCLSRVKVKREFLYNQTPIAYTTSRKFMHYSPVSYKGLKQHMRTLRSLSAQAPVTPSMHSSLTGKWDTVNSQRNRWNKRSYARQLRHESRRARCIARVFQQWTSPTEQVKSVKTKFNKNTKLLPTEIPMHEQLSSMVSTAYWRTLRANPDESLARRRTKLLSQLSRRLHYRRLTHLSWKTKRSMRYKYFRKTRHRSALHRSLAIKRNRVPVAETAGFLLPNHSQSTTGLRARRRRLLHLRRLAQMDYARYQSTSRTVFARQHYWHHATPQPTKITTPQQELQIGTANWLRAYTTRTTHAPSVLSHWNMAQFALTRRRANYRLRLSPKAYRPRVYSRRFRKAISQRRFILGNSRLDVRRRVMPYRRPRHRKIARVTAANWRFAPVQTAPFIHVYRTSPGTREVDVLVAQKNDNRARRYIRRETAKAERKAKNKGRIIRKRFTVRTVRSQQRNIRYYQEIERVARELRRLRWRKRRIKRRKSASVFGLARILLHPDMNSLQVARASTPLESLRKSTRVPTKQKTVSLALPATDLLPVRPLTNYVRVMERLRRRHARRMRLRRKLRRRRKIWKRSTKRVAPKKRRKPIAAVTIAQQIPQGRMLLPLPTIVGQLGAKLSNSHMNHLMISHSMVSSLYNQTLRFFMARTWATNFTAAQCKDTPLITNVNPKPLRRRRAGTRYRGRVQSFSKFKMFQSYLGTRLKLALQTSNNTFTQI